jgi:uncharacterized membrane protein YfcA
MAAAAIAFGVLIGTSLGMLGGGGSILTVPVFVYVLGFAPKDSIAMSLAVVGVASVAGAIGHWRSGNVNLRTAALFGGTAMAGTWAGTRLAAYVTGATQLLVFAIVMLAAAGFMARPRREIAVERRNALSGARLWTLLIAEALAVGLLTGLVGVGGGFLIVPALVLLGVGMRIAVGTSLVIIATNCAVGFSGYLGQVQIAWSAMALVIAGTLPGIWAGTALHGRLSQQRLRQSFAVFLVLVAAFIVYRNLPTVVAAMPR